MAKHYRCRGFVNGKAVTIRLDAESELDAVNKFHQKFVDEGHDPSIVTRVAVKEKKPPKSATLRFSEIERKPREPKAAPQASAPQAAGKKAAAKKGK